MAGKEEEWRKGIWGAGRGEWSQELPVCIEHNGYEEHSECGT